MGSPFGILLILLLSVIMFVGVVWSLMWGLSLLHHKLALAIGFAALAYIVLSAGQTLWGCAADPVLVPPVSGEIEDGRMTFACDGPGGMLSYGYALVFAPLAFITVAISMMWLRRREMKNV